MAIKTCCKCGEERPLGDFHRNRRSPDGRCARCKPCARAITSAWHVANPERAAATRANRDKAKANAASIASRKKKPEHYNALNRAWRARNPDSARAHGLKYRDANRPARRERSRAFYLANPARYAAYNSDRRARILRQTIALTLEQRAAMFAAYDAARALTATSGIRHEVDHIIPLNGRKVLGLHVPWNLQILTAEANRRKFNRVAL